MPAVSRAETNRERTERGRGGLGPIKRISRLLIFCPLSPRELKLPVDDFSWSLFGPKVKMWVVLSTMEEE